MRNPYSPLYSNDIPIVIELENNSSTAKGFLQWIVWHYFTSPRLYKKILDELQLQINSRDPLVVSELWKPFDICIEECRISYELTKRLSFDTKRIIPHDNFLIASGFITDDGYLYESLISFCQESGKNVSLSGEIMFNISIVDLCKAFEKC